VIDRTAFLRGLIGKRWAAGACGPEAFDCWHLARHVQKELFSRELPSISVPDDPGWAWLLETIVAHPERARWVERPTLNGHLINAHDGALVLLARAQRAAHVGVWLAPECGVIHCDQGGGVKFEDAATLRASGWRKLMFFVPRQHDRDAAVTQCLDGKIARCRAPIS
jgi:cell wall-associated NlpC family hydrolase